MRTCIYLFVSAAVPLNISYAAVVTFDNTSTTFVWVANGGESTPGAFFDPVLTPAGQGSFNITRSLSQGTDFGGGSNSVIANAILTNPQIRLARTTETRTVLGPRLGQETVFENVGRVFQPGQSVGATALFDSVGGVVTGAFNIGLGSIPFLGQHPYLGFRVILADGLPHFGWIEFDYRNGPLANGSDAFFYQPVRWAYETLPNTPITVVPAPGAGALVAILAVVSWRRRRAV